MAQTMTGDPQKQAEHDGKPEGVPIWLARLAQAELVVLVAYAVSLPLSMTLTWVLFIVGLVLWAVVTIADLILGLRPACANIAQAPLALPLMVMALAITISGAFNGGTQAGQIGSDSMSQAWRSLYSLKTMLPYFWAFCLVRRSKTSTITAVLLLLWASALGGIWGSVEQIFNIHPGYKWLQGTGFHGHPMAFAGQMQLFSMLCLGLLLGGAYKNLAHHCPHPYLRWIFDLSQRSNVFILIVLANFSGLFFAGERSAWLGGFAGVLAVTMLKSWRFALKSLLASSFLAGLSFLFVPLARTRISDMFSGHDPSISARQKIWGDCLQHYFPQSPVFGLGWLNFPHFDIQEAIVPGVSKDLIHAHSNYIQILTTTGIIGLASYIFLLIWTFKVAIARFRLSENDQFSKGLAMGIFGAAVSLAVAGIFEFNFGTAQVRLAQWFLLAFL